MMSDRLTLNRALNVAVMNFKSTNFMTKVKEPGVCPSHHGLNSYRTSFLKNQRRHRTVQLPTAVAMTSAASQ